MIWFKHDNNASTDAKIKKLLIRHGVTGYAVYFHCLELISSDISETNITFKLEHDSEIIADNLKIKGTADQSGIEIVEEVMRYIIELGLFNQNSNGHIFCYKLLKRLDSSMTSNPKFRKLITNAKKSHDSIMINHDTIMQEENRIEENRIDKNKIKKEREILKKPKNFIVPDIQDIKDYILTNNLNNVNAESFYYHYESNGWLVGKNKMKDWKKSVSGWNARAKKEPKKTETRSFQAQDRARFFESLPEDMIDRMTTNDYGKIGVDNDSNKKASD